MTNEIRTNENLVSVHLGLVWPLNLKTKIFGLDWGQLGQLGIYVRQVKSSNLLIENLRQNVDANFELLGLAKLDVLLSKSLILTLEQQDLSKDLIGERAGHDER
jgi:hypothetical protein